MIEEYKILLKFMFVRHKKCCILVLYCLWKYFQSSGTILKDSLVHVTPNYAEPDHFESSSGTILL
jgi:hypothetical protein